MHTNKNKYKAVILKPRKSLEIERNILEEFNCSLIQGKGNTPEEIIETARGADALIASGNPINKEVIAALDKLKIIALIGVGFDTVDIKAASDNGIIVTNVPDLIAEIVADHAVALILSLIRRIPQADRMVRQGNWESDFSKWAKPVPKLRGLTTGIIGFGRTGREVASRLISFGFDIIAYDPYAKELPQTKVKIFDNLEDLLKKADVITIHVNFSKETNNLIKEEELKLMKETAFLINVSRGGVINEEALTKALTQGWIAGAALDVTKDEPPKNDNPLLKLENIIITPHIAYYSDESVIEQRKRTANEVARVIQGLPPLFPVN